MRKLLYLCAIVLVVSSCDNLFEPKLRPTPDSELGDDFKLYESWIDMSQTNRFNESLFCNDWILSKVTYERYMDGVLTETEDITDTFAKDWFSLKDDHTIRTSIPVTPYFKDKSGKHCFMILEYTVKR